MAEAKVGDWDAAPSACSWAKSAAATEADAVGMAGAPSENTAAPLLAVRRPPLRCACAERPALARDWLGERPRDGEGEGDTAGRGRTDRSGGEAAAAAGCGAAAESALSCVIVLRLLRRLLLSECDSGDSGGARLATTGRAEGLAPPSGPPRLGDSGVSALKEADETRDAERDAEREAEGEAPETSLEMSAMAGGLPLVLALSPPLVTPACTLPASAGVERPDWRFAATELGEAKTGAGGGDAAANGDDCSSTPDNAIMEGEASDAQRPKDGSALGESSG